MKKKLFAVVCLVFFGLLLGGQFIGAQEQSPNLTQLQQDAQEELEITMGVAGWPTFIRGDMPVTQQDDSSTALERRVTAFLAKYGEAFGISDASSELALYQVETDSLAMTHLTFHQIHKGLPVFGGWVKVHLDASGQTMIAVSNGFVPGINLENATPKLAATQAVNIAYGAMPDGVLVSDPKLVVYPLAGQNYQGAESVLSWQIELRNDLIPARQLYFVNALDGTIAAVLDRLYIERSRQTYNANNECALPGDLARSEGDSPTGDIDVDNAHDFAGATYDYFSVTHGRDSYDNQGAVLTSTVHYCSNYQNAFWNGEQTAYGDEFPVNDVVAHEWTHAVTEHSAALEYRWQSGALNESFSDIFGAMVDREDWLMGEDLPSDVLGGREAIRDLADPTRFGQPDHTDNWVATCSDNEGVHTNSGITNKAYYNIAAEIGKEKAEQIFFRTLVTYLQPTSSLEDTRAGALQSAEDIYGADSAEYIAVETGFNQVGLDGVWNPPPNDCTCVAGKLLSNDTTALEPQAALRIALTLYRVRDELLTSTSTGRHYHDLYYKYTGQLTRLILSRATLRTTAEQLLLAAEPGLARLLDGDGNDVIVTAELVEMSRAYLKSLVSEARANGDEELAQTIEQEIVRIEWDALVGMTYEEAWAFINVRLALSPAAYLPLLSQ